MPGLQRGRCCLPTWLVLRWCTPSATQQQPVLFRRRSTHQRSPGSCWDLLPVNVQQQCAQPHRVQRHPLHEVVQPHPPRQRSLTGVAAHSQTKVGPSIAAPTSQEQQATLQVRTPKHATVSATFQHHRNTTQTASTGHSCLPAHLHQPTLHSSPQHDMGAGIFQQQLQAHTTGFTVS